jgi:hypothetical protein
MEKWNNGMMEYGNEGFRSSNARTLKPDITGGLR